MSFFAITCVSCESVFHVGVSRLPKITVKRREETTRCKIGLNRYGLSDNLNIICWRLREHGRDTRLRTTSAVPRPGYLERIVDPVLGTTIIRITDAGNPVLNSTNAPSQSSLSWEDQTGHGYSSRAAWNADQSLLMMEKEGHRCLEIKLHDHA